MKLKTLRIMAIITGILGSTLFNRFLEGGALFMSLNSYLFITVNLFYDKSLLQD